MFTAKRFRYRFGLLPCFSCSNPFVTYLPPPSTIAAAAFPRGPLLLPAADPTAAILLPLFPFRTSNRFGLWEWLNTILRIGTALPDKESHQVVVIYMHQLRGELGLLLHSQASPFSYKLYSSRLHCASELRIRIKAVNFS